MKNDGTLHHVLSTEWFIGQCENTDCKNTSVKWSEKSQQHLCWSCTADAGYKTAAAYAFDGK